MIEIYTDGACRGNPGPGGWAALLQTGKTEKELHGAEALTTNNRMELTAVIRALEALTRPVQARVYTDSEYVRRGITEWLTAWKARGWRTAARKAPAPRAQVQVVLRGDDLEPQQYQPLAQPPLRQHAPHARRETRAAPARAHAPQAPGLKSQHQQLPLAPEHSIHLTQNGVRIGGEFQRVRQERRINTVAN